MNYKKIYERLVKTRQIRQLNPNEYYEKHHIIPKSLGGSDDESNLVCLTFREHFIAHWLLYKICEGNDKFKMSYAWFCLINNFSNDKQNRRYTSRKYEMAKSAILNQWTEDKRKEWRGYHRETWKSKELLNKHSKILKLKMREPVVRERHLNAIEKSRKIYLVYTLNGTEYIIKGLNRFAKSNNLQQSKLSSVVSGNRKHHYGIWIKQIDDILSIYDNILDNVVLNEKEKLTKKQSIKKGQEKRSGKNHFLNNLSEKDKQKFLKERVIKWKEALQTNK